MCLQCRLDNKEWPRHQRHHQMNDIVWRTIKWAQITAAKEPVSLIQQDGKRPDGTTMTTLLPWARGKPMAWDATVPDTYDELHVDQTAREACSAANKAAANKIVKYGTLSAFHIFLPVAVETDGTWNQSAMKLIQEIGRRITAVVMRHTQEKRCSCSSAYLLLFKR